MKLTIVHISDPHWIPDTFKNDDGALSSSETQRSYERFAVAFEHLDLSKHYGDTNLLVHTGDSGNLYAFSKLPMAVQFIDIKNNLLSLLERKFQNIKRCAVPGNHDYEIKCAPSASEADRFADFNTAFKGWSTCFSEPFINIPFGQSDEILISLWLINSAKYCGKDFSATPTSAAITGQIGVVNPNAPLSNTPKSTVFIDNHTLKEYRSNHKDATLRVAIMHHNPVQQYGQSDRPEKNDVFINAGDFSTFLVRHNFKLVLCGHQHIGNEIFTAIPDKLEKGFSTETVALARPYAESGFLSLTAPSFLREEGSVLPGFNVIELEITPDRNLAELILYKYKCDRSNSNVQFRHEQPVKYSLLLKRMDELGIEGEEQERRINSVRQTMNYVYNKESYIDPLERVLRITKEPIHKNHISEIKVAVNNCQRISPANIFGVYALSVMPPESWWANQLSMLFRGLFIENVNRARDRGKGMSVANTIPMHFCFSPSLSEAIQISKVTATKFNVSGKVLSDLTKTQPMLLDYVNSTFFPNELISLKDSSISVWRRSINKTDYDEKNYLPDVIAHRRGLILSESSHDLPNTFSHADAKSLRKVYEVARIALWPPKYLDSDYALEMIRFHEDFFVPLFWLDPARLVFTGSNPRKRIGLFILYAWESADDLSEKTELQHRAMPFYNNRKGEFPVERDLYTRNFERKDAALWGRNKAPRVFLEKNHYPVTEFTALLRRPDIMFAIDAWAMRKSNNWNFVHSYLSELNEKCKQWFTLQ